MGKTTVTLLEGMRFAGRGDSGHEVYMDASPKVGGNDSAPRPLELMLFALGGCTGMDVISILRKMRTEPSSFQVEITSEQAVEHPKVFTKLHIIYRVSSDVPEENLSKAIDLSLSRYCPVTNALAKVAKITSEFIIE